MLLRRWLIPPTNHRRSCSAGLSVNNEAFAAKAPNDGLSDPRPLTATRRTVRLSKAMALAASKDKRWEPSRGFKFSQPRTRIPSSRGTLWDRTLQVLSATTPDASSLNSPTPRSLPIKPYKSRPIPYTTAQPTTNTSYMLPEDDRDGFRDDEEDLGEHLALNESPDGISSVPVEAEAQPVKDAQQRWEAGTLRMDHTQPKAPVMFRASPHVDRAICLLARRPKARQPQKSQASSKIGTASAPSKAITIGPSRPPTLKAVPKTDLAKFNAHYLCNQYPHDWSTQKKSEPLVSQEHLLSAEIADMAQLPRVMDQEDTIDAMLKALYQYKRKVSGNYYRVQRHIDGMIDDLRRVENGSYRPLISKMELVEMHADIWNRNTDTSTYAHDARRLIRFRDGLKGRMKFVSKSRYAKAVSEAASNLLIQRYQATETVDWVIYSQQQLYVAWCALVGFYRNRQMIGLGGRPVTQAEPKTKSPFLIIKKNGLVKSIGTLWVKFEEAYAYKELIQEQFSPGPFFNLIAKTNHSLRILLYHTQKWLLAVAETDRIGGRGRKKQKINRDFNRLKEALWDFADYEVFKMALERDMKTSAHVRSEGSACSISPPQDSLRKSGDQDIVLQPGKTILRAPKPIDSQIGRFHDAVDTTRRIVAENHSKAAGKRQYCPPSRNKDSRECVGQHDSVSQALSFDKSSKRHESNTASLPSARAARAVSTSNDRTHAEIHRLHKKKQKDQKSIIKIQSRSHSIQVFRMTPERSITPPIFLNPECSLQTHIDSTTEAEQAIDGVNILRTSSNTPREIRVESQSPSQASFRSVALAAKDLPPSHSPKGFSMNRSEHGSPVKADLSTQPTYWSYSRYSGPKDERIKVHYCKNKVDTERVAQMFKDENVIGFDIEWKASAQVKDGIKKNVSLIQIASEERVALFHIARFREDELNDNLVAPTFKAIMESQQIKKVGVAIKGDCTRLRRFMGIESKGLLELSHLHKLVKYSRDNVGSINKVLVSLATQVEEHLGLPLWKGDARTSDWSLDLDLKQVQYAASDSYAGFQLFHTLEHKRKQLNPTPPRPYPAELNLPIRLTSGESIETDDEPEEPDDGSLTTSQPGHPTAIEELARDFSKIKLRCPTLPTKPQPKRSPRANTQPCKPEVILANEWVANWRTTLPQEYKPAAAPACLRAHALWHEQGFTVPEAAALLRDPPLLNATVATYVLDALRAEKLPFEKERLAALILHVPPAMKGRYKRFFEKAGIFEF